VARRKLLADVVRAITLQHQADRRLRGRGSVRGGRDGLLGKSTAADVCARARECVAPRPTRVIIPKKETPVQKYAQPAGRIGSRSAHHGRRSAANMLWGTNGDTQTRARSLHAHVPMSMVADLWRAHGPDLTERTPAGTNAMARGRAEQSKRATRGSAQGIGSLEHAGQAARAPCPRVRSGPAGIAERHATDPSSSLPEALPAESGRPSNLDSFYLKQWSL
jgi:hypothetical protein